MCLPGLHGDPVAALELSLILSPAVGFVKIHHANGADIVRFLFDLAARRGILCFDRLSVGKIARPGKVFFPAAHAIRGMYAPISEGRNG